MERDLIIETDVGRDADDFFAICYLASVPGVRIRAITVSPGDKDQISVAKFLVSKLGLDCPVGSAKPAREQSSVGGVHPHVLARHGWPERMAADGRGADVIRETLASHPDADLLCIGPLQSVGPFLRENPNAKIRRAVMQGGFCGYHIHRPTNPLSKFEGLVTCPTFNLGGDKKSAQLFVDTPQVASKWFVGKNVCHSVVYEPKTLDLHKASVRRREGQGLPEGQRMFLDAMELFFGQGAPFKAFHDPLAAWCLLHPDRAQWIDGRLFYQNGEWGTSVADGDRPHRVLVDIDRDALWSDLCEGR